jgi:adenylyltransferase/sulfurtransferase
VSDACYFTKKPLITAALGASMARSPPSAPPEGRRRQANRRICLFPNRRHPAPLPPRRNRHSGALTGVIGSIAALEVIARLSASAKVVGRLIMLDASASGSRLAHAWDTANPLTGTKPTIKDLSIHA